MRYRLQAGGMAVGVDGDRLIEPTGEFDLSFTLPAGELRPGLINAHDHLHRNHYPQLGSPPYPDAYAWGRDLHERHAREIAQARALPRRDALLYGALRNLRGGVTTVVHHDAWEPDFECDFPVRVVRLDTVHSPGFTPDDLIAAAESHRLSGTRLAVHVAEGTNQDAAEEVRMLDRLGLLNERLLAVHAVGVDADGIERLRDSGAAIVWCPSSNVFLFGRTCPRELLEQTDVILGTDSRLTGAGTMLDELRGARALELLDDDRLVDAVGLTAALRLGLAPPDLGPGSLADLVLLERPLLDASPADVVLVVVGGRPQLAATEFAPLFAAAGIAAGPVAGCDPIRLAALPLAAAAARAARSSVA